MDNAYLFTKLLKKKGQTRHLSLPLLSQYHLSVVPKVYKFGLLIILFRSKNVTNSWKQQYFCIDSNTLIDFIALIEQYFYTLINQSYFVTKHMVWKEFRLERNTFYFLYFVLTMQGWENM